MVAIVFASARWPIVALAFPGQRLLAVMLALAGVLVAVLGVTEFRRARTTVNPMAPERSSAIVSSGVYRISRNPMYLGFAAALLGLAVWFSSLAGYALVAAFCALLTRLQIIPEERILRERFGTAYADYQGRVRRWI